MGKKFEKIGLIYNQKIEKSFETAEKFSQKIKDCVIYSLDNMQNSIDLAIVIGGDGSFLRASRYYSDKKIPLLGFNMGRLGYLAQVKPHEFDEVLNKLNLGEYTIENRLMLKSKKNKALNDIVIKGENSTRTATLDLYINEKFLCSYVADGIIVSTPTGSTAYSLSAGGPVVAPSLNCCVIIPICPHTLNARAIVVPSDEVIKIKNHEKGKLNVAFDGQVNIMTNGELEIKRSEDFAKILILNQQKDKFYDILKEKLHWSLSPKK